MNTTALREPVASKAGKNMVKNHRPQQAEASPKNTPKYLQGAELLFGLDQRFPREAIEQMLCECVAATGEMGVDEALKSLWLTGNAIDVTVEQSRAIGRTLHPDVQARLELIVRGFLAAPVAIESEGDIKRDVKPHLKCRACASGRAKKRLWQEQINASLVKRRYLCDNPECGAKWDVEVRVTEEDGIETKTTEVVAIYKNG